MPTEIEANEFMLRCDCGDKVEHVAWLIHDAPDDEPPHHHCWYLMTSLDRRFGFWKRMWTGLRYTFRPTTLRYYGYSEIVLLDADVDALASFIQRRRGLEQ